MSQVFSCSGRVGRSVCPLAPRRPSFGRLVDVPSLRFFFLRDYLDAMPWRVASLLRWPGSVRVYHLGHVVGGTRVFFGTLVITISFCSSRSLLAFFLLARVFRSCARSWWSAGGARATAPWTLWRTGLEHLEAMIRAILHTARALALWHSMQSELCVRR